MKTFISMLALALWFFSFQAHAQVPPQLMQIDQTVFRGVQPQTDADYAAIKATGINTILNLRWDKSVAQSKIDAESRGFKFLNVPINAVKGPTDAEIAQVWTILNDPSNGKILFHCTLGRDRTGLISALYRVKVQGWKPADAYKEWTGFGFSNSFLKALDGYFKSATAMMAAPASKTCSSLFVKSAS